jgi:hypothetical protein
MDLSRWRPPRSAALAERATRAMGMLHNSARRPHALAGAVTTHRMPPAFTTAAVLTAVAVGTAIAAVQLGRRAIPQARPMAAIPVQVDRSEPDRIGLLLASAGHHPVSRSDIFADFR